MSKITPTEAQAAVDACGSVSAAAKSLGIPRTTFSRLLKASVKMVVAEVVPEPTIVEAPAEKVKIKMPRAGSKTAQALEIVKRIGVAQKKECVAELQNAFNTTKSNANAYLFNVKKYLTGEEK